MSWRTAHITAYDCLDRVVVSCKVLVDLGDGTAPEMWEAESVHVTGLGRDEDREWLRDCIVGLLESL
jgi:hypothetical protein